MTVANTGSESLSYDGDCRVACFLLCRSRPEIRRVEYDVARQRKALLSCCLPHAEWVATLLESASLQMP